MAGEKSKAGRTPSPEGRIAIKLTVPPYVAKKLKASGNASAAVKALVDAEIAGSSVNQTGAKS